MNVWPQCQDCNRNKHGRLDVFEAKLRAMYGNDAIDELIELAYSIDKVSEEDMRGVINRYG